MNVGCAVISNGHYAIVIPCGN